MTATMIGMCRIILDKVESGIMKKIMIMAKIILPIILCCGCMHKSESHTVAPVKYKAA